MLIPNLRYPKLRVFSLIIDLLPPFISLCPLPTSTPMGAELLAVLLSNRGHWLITSVQIPTQNSPLHDSSISLNTLSYFLYTVIVFICYLCCTLSMESILEWLKSHYFISISQYFKCIIIIICLHYNKHVFHTFMLFRQAFLKRRLLLQLTILTEELMMTSVAESSFS